MKIVICLLALGCLTGCVQTGYSPSYIISEAPKEAPHPASEAKKL